MVKIEQNKCEKLINHAIECIEQAKINYERYVHFFNESNFNDAELELRKSDQLFGQASGIYEVLVFLNFKSEKMDDLFKMICV